MGNVVSFDADAVGVIFVTVALPFVLSRFLGIEGICLGSLFDDCGNCLFCKRNVCDARFSFIDVEFINRRELQWRIIDDVIIVCQCVRGRVAESSRPRFRRNHTFCNSDWTCSRVEQQQQQQQQQKKKKKKEREREKEMASD